MLRRAFGEARRAAKQALGTASGIVWRESLDRQQVRALLEPWEIETTHAPAVTLPAMTPVAGPVPERFSGVDVPVESEHVWRVTTSVAMRSLSTAASGTVLLNNRLLLDTDFGTSAGLIEAPWRRRMRVDVAIAPWSHKWAVYFDYLMYVVAKLCRIRETVGESAFAGARVCYPMIRTPFETQLLARLGVPADRVIDTTKYAVAANTLITSNNQQSWLPSPSSVHALRRAFLGDAPAARTGRRIYVARGGRRRVKNQDQLRRTLEAVGVETLDDVPRDVEAQIRLFRGAELIISPHGSALGNLVWCEPGTRVIELLSSSYALNFFLYLSRLLGLRYSYLVDPSRRALHWTNTAEDIAVDTDALRREIERLDSRTR
jgi:hypothetical protein